MSTKGKGAVLALSLGLALGMVSGGCGETESKRDRLRKEAREVARLGELLNAGRTPAEARHTVAMVRTAARDMVRERRFYGPGLLRSCGLVLHKHGDQEGAVALLEEALNSAWLRVDVDVARIELGRVLAADDPARARELYETAIASMEQAGVWGAQVWNAMRALADLHRAGSRWEAAVETRDRVIARLDSRDLAEAWILDYLLRENADDLDSLGREAEADTLRRRAAEVILATEGVGDAFVRRLMSVVNSDRAARGEIWFAESMREVYRDPRLRGSVWGLVPGSRAVRSFHEAGMDTEAEELVDEMVMTVLAREAEIDAMGDEGREVKLAARNVLFLAGVRIEVEPADRAVMTEAAADAFLRRYATEAPEDVSQRRNLEQSRGQRLNRQMRR
jgi:tetratricopeptide (TPR) repeat protein